MTGTQEAPRRRREPGILPESVVDWALLGARRPRAQDRAIDGVLLVLMLINATLRVEPGHATLLGSAVALALWLPLSLLRCRAPALALAACVLTDSAWIVWAPPAVGTGNAPLGAVQPAPLATAAAALTLAARAPLSIGGPAEGAAGLVLLAVCALARPWPELPAGLISLSGVVLLSMAGVSVASLRGAREERRSRRAQEVLDAVHGERLRIARDLHDSLAHRLTLVNAQAGVAAYLLATDPGRAAEALNGIEDQSRAAIDELRSTLAVLREEDEDADAAVTPGREPAPDLATSARSSTSTGARAVRSGSRPSARRWW